MDEARPSVEMSTPTVSPNAAPAHALWVQLATRIATQPLHYRSGEEERAAWSLFLLFEKTRQLLEAHREAAEFRTVAVSLLNDTLRPYTARWHGWMTEDKERLSAEGKPLDRFRDERVRRQFRKELKELRGKLCEVQKRLAKLAGIKDLPSTDKQPEAGLGKPVLAGIGKQVQVLEPPESSAKTVVALTEINAVEHQDILRRRIALETLHEGDQPRSLWEPPAGGPPPPEPPLQPEINDTIGLALSGGGIRSATFCLGIVQVLVRKGLLPQFDYVSTVSGGGYLGSFLSCALGTRQPGDTAPTTKKTATDKLDNVFLRQEEKSRQQGIESGLMRHLRNNSKYLLKGGTVGKAWMIGLMLSGLLWNVLIMLPLPLGLALLTYCYEDCLWAETFDPQQFSFKALGNTLVGQCLQWVAVLFGALWLVLPGVQLLAHGREPRSKGYAVRRVWQWAVLALGLITAALGVLCLVPALFQLPEWLHEKLAEPSLERLTNHLSASLTGVAGAVLAAFAAWLTPKWPRLQALAVKLLILSGPLLLLFTFLLVGNQMGLGRTDGPLWNPSHVLLVALVLGLWDWLCVNINTLSPHRYYRNRLCECYLARRIREVGGFKASLIRALSGEKAQGATEVLKQVKLTSLGADLTAPYHIVNMAINVPGSANKELRGRGSDFFFASRRFCGSPLTGYVRTQEVERIDPHFDLGTAMAVSAAAASTNMGWKTLPHLRFLMTLFNVRLGYWLRNPGKPAFHRFLSGAGPLYLFREMLGWMDEKCRYVNLSDGGHIENLGAYELLRRQCKFIVCVDAGQEPGMECSDLMRLQRYAEIDLGLRMYFDIADLQIGPNGLSRAHAILVKIDYAPEPAARPQVVGAEAVPARGAPTSGPARTGCRPGHERAGTEAGAPTTSGCTAEQAKRDKGRGTSDQLGWMLYLKLAMTGVEPNHVMDYHRQNPDFPHQSTGDQIYEEDQFEAYRALGECAMAGMFRAEIVGSTAPPADVHAWFQCLANNLLPDNDEAFPESERRSGNGVA